MTGRGDLLAGAALFVLGAAMGLAARGFPSIGAVTYGPGLFPTIVAVGLMASGLGIVVEALAGAAPPRAASDEPAGGLRAGPVLALLGVVAFYALALPALGFHVATAASLLAAARIFGGGWAVAAVLTVAGALALHAVFYNLLRVPLPWGLLEPVAW